MWLQQQPLTVTLLSVLEGVTVTDYACSRRFGRPDETTKVSLILLYLISAGRVSIAVAVSDGPAAVAGRHPVGRCD